MSGDTFTQHRQIGVCKVCRRPIHRQRGVAREHFIWVHSKAWSAGHPPHDVVYLEGQRTTPGEGMILLSAWLSWHGYVLACQKNDEAWLTTSDGCDVGDGLEGPVLSDWSAIPADVWHETYKVEPS